LQHGAPLIAAMMALVYGWSNWGRILAKKQHGQDARAVFGASSMNTCILFFMLAFCQFLNQNASI
jgi:heme O synthase-like polyprenyltransferase